MGQTLASFVADYSASRDLRKSSVDQLLYAVCSLSRYLERPATLDDLRPAVVNMWMTRRLENGIARKTVAVQRVSILSLWREARRIYRKDETVRIAPIIGVRTIRLEKSNPLAWWPGEFAKLMDAARYTRGAFPCGVPRALLLRSLIACAYYTGLRASDLLALRTVDALARGKLIIPQQKTGELIDATLPPDALALVLATQPESRERLFPLTKDQLCRWMRKLCDAAEIPGSAKWLRRTGATRCEQQKPGSSMAYLGHKTPGLAYRHYVDRRQIDSDKPMPPPLGETG